MEPAAAARPPSPPAGLSEGHLGANLLSQDALRSRNRPHPHVNDTPEPLASGYPIPLDDEEWIDLTLSDRTRSGRAALMHSLGRPLDYQNLYLTYGIGC